MQYEAGPTSDFLKSTALSVARSRQPRLPTPTYRRTITWHQGRCWRFQRQSEHPANEDRRSPNRYVAVLAGLQEGKRVASNRSIRVYWGWRERSRSVQEI